MTNSALQATCTPFEDCLGIIRQASVEILLLLGVHAAEGKDPRWFLEQLDQARLNLGGWGAVARRLQMNDAQLSQFTLRLRHLQQSVPQYENGQDVSENQLISALRFVASLEQLRQQQPILKYQTEIAPVEPDAQMRAQRQLRAIELTLKSLIARVWPDQHPLNSFLKQHFGGERLRRWLKLGEGRDALDGMMFSELALMVVDKKLFVRHFTQIFNDTSVLMSFVEPRITLRMFLDDCRLARNCVIAQQPLTSVQLMLLDYQYRQITHPVQRAFEERRTRINPASYATHYANVRPWRKPAWVFPNRPPPGFEPEADFPVFLGEVRDASDLSSRWRWLSAKLTGGGLVSTNQTTLSLASRASSRQREPRNGRGTVQMERRR